MTQAQGPFAQLPYSLWTFPDLLPLERWLCATIIRLCWKPGPQAFSYRTIAKESGISIGSLCHSPQHEGMIPKLERLKLIKTYKPVDDDKKIKKGIGFLVEPTDLLWQLNHQEQGAYSVSTSKPESTGEGAYSVNATAYLLSTGDYSVSTSAQSVSTKRGVTQGQKHDEKPPIYIDSIDSNISLVVSAHAESDGGASFLSSLSQFEDTLQEVQNGQAPLYTSCIPPGHEEEPVKSAGDSEKPAPSAANDTTPLQETPTQVVHIQTTKPAPPTKTHEQDELKIRRKIKECPPEIQARRRKWQAYFNQRRGGELLPTKGECIGESNAIASLVDKFSDAELEVIDTFVLAEIFPFKVPANKHKLGGCALLKESQNAREVLKDRLKWPGQVIVPVEEPKIVGWTPVRQIYPPKGVTVTYG